MEPAKTLPFLTDLIKVVTPTTRSYLTTTLLTRCADSTMAASLIAVYTNVTAAVTTCTMVQLTTVPVYPTACLMTRAMH